MSQATVEELSRLLRGSESEHRNYQALPDFALDRLKQFQFGDYAQDQVSLDAPRFDWLGRHLDCSGKKVSEIGANLGYFCLRLAREHGAQAHAFEPIGEYARSIEILAALTGLDGQIVASAVPIGLSEIGDLPRGDLLICLNVLHHAGRSFATDEVRTPADWRNYARRYLTACRQAGEWLLFQTGNMQSGEPLFAGDEIVPFTRELLEDSGWQVNQLGLIIDFDELTYESFADTEIARAPVFHCRRNQDTGLVDYFHKGQCVASLMTGLAQRPLWLCRRA